MDHLEDGVVEIIQDEQQKKKKELKKMRLG